MAATDVTTYERARLALNIGTADSSRREMLEAAITAVSQRLDELCGPIVQRTIGPEIIDTDGDDVCIHLSTGPVASITSVTLYEDGVPTVLTAETLTAAGGYLAELQRRIRPDGTTQLLSGVLRKRGTFADETWDRGRVAVVYVAGRYANTSAVLDSRFEQAALLTLRSLWRAYGQQVEALGGEYAVPFQSFPTVTIPPAALELVHADRIHLVGIA